MREKCKSSQTKLILSKKNESLLASSWCDQIWSKTFDLEICLFLKKKKTKTNNCKQLVMWYIFTFVAVIMMHPANVLDVLVLFFLKAQLTFSHGWSCPLVTRICFIFSKMPQGDLKACQCLFILLPSPLADWQVFSSHCAHNADFTLQLLWRQRREGSRKSRSKSSSSRWVLVPTDSTHVFVCCLCMEPTRRPLQVPDGCLWDLLTPPFKEQRYFFHLLNLLSLFALP